MSFNEIYSLVLLIGSLLMFIMSFLLWFSRKGFLHNKILGALVFTWSFCTFNFAIQSRDFFIQFPHFWAVGSNLMFLFFPLMYIYVKTFLLKKERVFNKYLFHFVPFIIFTIIIAPFYIKSSSEKAVIIEHGAPFLVNAIKWGDIFIIVSGVLYSVLSFRVLQVFESSHENKISIRAAHTLGWIRLFLTINLILLGIGSAGVFIEVLNIKIPFDVFKINYLGLTILTISTGLFTFFSRNFFDDRSDEIEFDKDQFIIDEPVFPLKKPKAGLKIVSSRRLFELKNTENEEDVEKIIAFIEETKPFLNKDMTLQSLAEDIGFTKPHVTKLLNTTVGSNFNDIINEYRVNEVIRLINEGKHEQHKLIYLSELSGFNSKTSFNRAFKKATGKTPSEFIDELILPNSNITGS